MKVFYSCRGLTRVVLMLVAFAVCGAAPPTSDADRLLQAAATGDSVLSLLEAGASPDVTNDAGRTPLHLAAAHGHRATSELLLNRGAQINAPDRAGHTPLDLAIQGGHSGLAQFLKSKGARSGKPAPPQPSPEPEPQHISKSAPRPLKSSLRFKTLEQFQSEIGQPAVVLDSTNVCFFAPARKSKEARIIFDYLVKAYDALHDIVGVHTPYKIAVFVFPKGNTNGWGGTSECSIEYDDSLLDLERQPEWTRHHVPHVSGYIEEMAHNFVHATRAQFGWEMTGWSLGMEVSRRIAGNPILEENLRATRQEQQRTFERYVRGGYRFPDDLPGNLCDRVHAWILHQAANRYGASFWPDFFREIRSQQSALADAVRLGDGDKIRNARYQITIGCFDRLSGLNFKKILADNQISLTTDIKSLHPESSSWDRRFTESAP